MAVRHGQESAYIQERRKWETQPVVVDAQWVSSQVVDGQVKPGYMDGTYITPLSKADGGRAPYVFQEYPKWLYKASRAEGGPVVSDSKLVHSEAEEANSRSRGFCVGQDEAIAAIHAEDLEHAKLAANRSWEERRMSHHARSEAAIVDEASIQHVPEIPQTPVKRGRPRKVQE